MGERAPHSSAGRIHRIERTDSHQLVQARRIVERYLDGLGVDLMFQDVDTELAAFPGPYCEPGGALLLASIDEEPMGTVAVRRLDAGVCEMKRLYVLPSGRGIGLGRRLACAAIEAGRRCGYRRMRLDTLRDMTAARAMYEGLGFVEIPPYYDNPLPGTRFMQLGLERK